MNTLEAMERRRARRWSAAEVPWVVGVHVSAAPAELLNISTGGVLVRTPRRPPMRPDALDRARERLLGNRLAFQKESGEHIGTSGHVVRCHVSTIRSGALLYDVAFSFDQPPALELPETFADESDASEGPVPAIGGPSGGATRIVAPDPDELLSELEGDAFRALYCRSDTRQADHVCDVIARLTAIDVMLVRIGATLRDVARHRTDGRTPEIVSRLAARVPVLQAMRAELAERAGRDTRTSAPPIASVTELEEELRQWHRLWP